jgi:hypothetical protein
MSLRRLAEHPGGDAGAGGRDQGDQRYHREVIGDLLDHRGGASETGSASSQILSAAKSLSVESNRFNPDRDFDPGSALPLPGAMRTGIGEVKTDRPPDVGYWPQFR